MSKELIAQSLELLRDVRDKVHGNVESIVIQQLDEVIELLEEAHKNSSSLKLTPQDVLSILGIAIKAIPEVVKLIDFLKEFSS